MKILLKLIISVYVIFISGCTTVTDMAATGGSRADGVVEMSYQYDSTQIVKIDKVKAQESAQRRCQSWGYKSAEAFDDGITNCVYRDFFSCNTARVTVRYQCIQ